MTLSTHSRKRPRTGQLLVPFAAPFLVMMAPLSAQGATVLFEKQFAFHSGIDNQDRHALAGAGDLNRDGIADVIVGRPSLDQPDNKLGAGAAYAYSGADGTLLWRVDGRMYLGQLGKAVAGAGDVNQDGFDDVVVGADGESPGGVLRAGSAYVCSGADGTVIWEFHGAAEADFMGNSVDGAGDVNRDGVPDVIVGMRWADPGGLPNAGSAFVYSGVDGSEIWRFDGQLHLGQLGWSVAGAGDVNGDGFADLAVLELVPGMAYVYSGKDGTTLWQFADLGVTVDGAGDVNGDGFADVLVGGTVRSGLDGAILWSFGGNGAAAGDVNQDGFSDVIINASACQLFNAETTIHSGRDGETLWEFHADTGVNHICIESVVPGDLNGDGFLDVIAGAGDVPETAFAAYVQVPTLVWYGSGLPGSGGITPAIGTGDELPQLGNGDFKIELTGAPGGAPFALAVSFSRAETPAFGGTLYGDYLSPGAVWLLGTTGGAAGSPGVGTATLPLPIHSPALVGITTYWQGFIADSASPLPIGLTHTGGLEVIMIR